MTERRPDDTAAAPAVGADLLLRRVRLVPLDGMPTPSVETDVLIRTGRITAVGPGLDRSGHGSRGGPGGRAATGTGADSSATMASSRLATNSAASAAGSNR